MTAAVVIFAVALGLIATTASPRTAWLLNHAAGEIVVAASRPVPSSAPPVFPPAWLELLRPVTAAW